MKLPVVAIIGQTNAGKSSLFNRLVRKSQAIVAREAGTTRDNVVGKVEGKYILIDTAGSSRIFKTKSTTLSILPI